MNRLRTWTLACAVSTILTMGLAPNAECQVGKSQGLIDLNVATEEELLALPHMNEAAVRAVTDGRPFTSIRGANSVLLVHLTEDQLTEVYGKAFVHINLNTATREEILRFPVPESAWRTSSKSTDPGGALRSSTERSASTWDPKKPRGWPSTVSYPST